MMIPFCYLGPQKYSFFATQLLQLLSEAHLNVSVQQLRRDPPETIQGGNTCHITVALRCMGKHQEATEGMHIILFQKLRKRHVDPGCRTERIKKNKTNHYHVKTLQFTPKKNVNKIKTKTPPRIFSNTLALGRGGIENSTFPKRLT